MKDLYRFKIDWPYHVSAGAVVFDKDFKKVCVLKRTAKNFGIDTWHLPKGTLRNNESLESATKREVLEESGLDIEIVGYLGAITQNWTTKNEKWQIDKTVHYFIAKAISSNGIMDNEHDELEWLDPESAKKKLSKEPKKEEKIIDRAVKFVELNFES